jgi:hypothetical protein
LPTPESGAFRLCKAGSGIHTPGSVDPLWGGLNCCPMKTVIRHRSRSWFKSQFAVLLGLCLMILNSRADTFLQASLPVSEFGYVDQYAPTITAKYSGEACVPTSQTNALIYLQNTQSSYLGSALTAGTTYSNDTSTVLNLGTADGTTIANGTYYVAGAIGLHNYLTSTAPTLTITQNAYYSTDLYGSYGSVPSYISFQDTGANSMYTALANGSGLYLGLSYSNSSGTLTSGGHSILVEGINWDSTLHTGTLSFIDPLDPGANSASVTGGYSNGVAISPVATTGTIVVDPSNPNLLLLSYRQYESSYYANGLPPSGDYSTVNTVIGFSETLSVAPEPSTCSILIVGVGSMCLFGRRRS